MDDLLREFVTETNESLDVVDVELVRFEQDPNNAKILDNVFRLVHTIKGTCGFLGLPRLEALAHAAETLMGKFRDGLPATNDAVTLILATIDRIKADSRIARTRTARAGRRRRRSDRRSGAHGRARRRRPRRRRNSRSERSRRRCWNGRCGRARIRSTISNAPSAKPPVDPPAVKAAKPAPAEAAARTTTAPRPPTSRSASPSIRSNT